MEYQDALGKWRSYTPDFLIHRKDGHWLIVEVKAKSAQDNDDKIDGPNGRKARAARRWEEYDPDRIKYTMVFAAGSDVTIAR